MKNVRTERSMASEILVNVDNLKICYLLHGKLGKLYTLLLELLLWKGSMCFLLVARETTPYCQSSFMEM